MESGELDRTWEWEIENGEFKHFRKKSAAQNAVTSLINFFHFYGKPTRY